MEEPACAREMCTPISSTNTSRLGSTSWATITRQMTLRNSSRSVALRPPFCGWSRSGLWSGTWWSGSRKSRSYGLHILAALGEGDKWALLEVLFEELADSLIHLGTFAGCLTRFQRLSPLGFGGVPLDGGDPDPEGTGRL